MSYHPAHLLRSFLGHVYSLEKPFVLSSTSTLLSLNLFTRCCGARSKKHENGRDIEEAAPFSRSCTCTCPCMSLFGASTRRIYSHLTCPSANFPFMFSCASLRCTFRASRVYSGTRFCCGLSFGDSSMHTKRLGTDSAQYCTTVSPFPEVRVPPNVSPSQSRFKLSWEDFIASLVRERKMPNVLSTLILS